jgi:hypothetical protein
MNSRIFLQIVKMLKKNARFVIKDALYLVPLRAKICSNIVNYTIEVFDDSFGDGL